MEKNYEIFENGQGKSQEELSTEKDQVTEIKDSLSMLAMMLYFPIKMFAKGLALDYRYCILDARSTLKA